ncbi:two-component system, OmpR family, sensor histidine kinase SenX3 [Actinokineospora alba]|uniref:Sensor-like histidine kinase SenX3 n=1 Tax=Actinokineospora alba TaxID=504798 RepID=A0A1H0PB17_9PSEU|nr:ATP-binding protein [Actinokineospora alba]TDP65705.1 two-component system sensor histidine kinase SenX3 [Actinokineospora alba]SDI67078.1 two-component system, OmpR family, sensor histidine kinase SenX3 [Actinokineospora alba]SDP01895.1 two-component system, OmpR family, sensor histidine kinase SenX3 [Actinokineospora alba]
MAAWIALSCGVLVGLFVGYLVGRARHGDPARRPAGPTVSDLVQRWVHSSHSGVVVLNHFGDVVIYNPRAEQLGLVRNRQVDERARKASELVLETGDPVEIDLSPLESRGGRTPEAVLGEVRPLGEGYTVVDADDQSDAVRLEATRRDFVANVSHELKTPVGAMALLAEAVLDAAEDPVEVRRFTTKILHEGNRLGTLVTELIALSRLQGAERLPDMNTVDVDAVVREALGRARLVMESTGIDVTTDADSGLLVEGDRTLLVTALSNLLENALAYSPPGNPVSLSRSLVDGFIEIAVTDRGIGIAEEEQQRVFERFYRVDKARSRATGGTGLGLAIVKHVAANHGGEVKLWSKPGLGSTFTLRIPAHLDAPAPAGADTLNGAEKTRSGRAAVASLAASAAPSKSDGAGTDHGGMA